MMFVLDTNVVSELRKVRSGKADAELVEHIHVEHVGSVSLKIVVVDER